MTMVYTSCYNDKADILYPSTSNLSNCDTTTITFTNQINPIINTYCLGCHGSATAASIGAGINLSNYNALKLYVTNGSLMNSILQNGKASPMPKSASKLDNCTITKVQIWINKGALNN